MYPKEVSAYFDQCRRLIQTMVIKSDKVARLINEGIKAKNPGFVIDETNPASWKYYINLSGKYHSLDTPIYVRSFDTQAMIVFDSQTLENHPDTRKAYEFGTRNYYQLIKDYPDMEPVINGALYPVDINKAIEAPDLSILRYDTSLVDTQEISLIDELQEWIRLYFHRWDVVAFESSDEYYPAAQWGVFSLNLFGKLLDIRQRNALTPQAHSFHIRQFLASHYGLDKYMPYLHIEQIMYLYRNIRYIERHIGHHETFLDLVKNLIEYRRLVPLYEVIIKQLHKIVSDLKLDIIAKKRTLTP